jgi:hypothetical protein
LIEVLAYLVARPKSAAHLTAAALSRVIEDHCPTLLIDEADSFMRDDGELRGLINSGFSKETAQVLRAVPVWDGWEVREFSTWCPQAISGIGRLADTIMDRSFVVEMKRRSVNQCRSCRTLGRTGRPALGGVWEGAEADHEEPSCQSAEAAQDNAGKHSDRPRPGKHSQRLPPAPIRGCICAPPAAPPLRKRHTVTSGGFRRSWRFSIRHTIAYCQRRRPCRSADALCRDRRRRRCDPRDHARWEADRGAATQGQRTPNESGVDQDGRGRRGARNLRIASATERDITRPKRRPFLRRVCRILRNYVADAPDILAHNRDEKWTTFIRAL